MFDKASNADLARSSAVLWAHGDNVLSSAWGARLPYTKEDLRLLLNLHALFAEKLCVVDSPLLHNEPLMELIMYDGYDALLTNSVIIPMLRTSVSDFDGLEYQLRQTGRYGLLNQTRARVYASFLNGTVSTILPTKDEYFREVLTEGYEKSLLNSDFLDQAGLLTVQNDLLQFIKKCQKRYGSDKVWRSMFFFFADELAKGQPRYAARLKWISAAVWNNVFVQALGLKPAFPHTYSQAILEMITKEREALCLDTEYVEGDPLENSTLTLNDFQRLNARNLLDIRKTSQAKSYFEKAKQVAEESNPAKARKLLLEAQETYLASLSDQVASIATGKYEKIYDWRKKLRIVRWSGSGGSIGIALASLFAGGPPILSLALFGAGLIWVLGGNLAESKLSKTAEKEAFLARQQWEAIKRSQGEQRPIISVAQAIRGAKPPLF